MMYTLQREHTGKTKIGSLMALLKAVFHFNNFIFLGEHYLQIGGTAMGTKVAPSYANIFMGNLEKRLLKDAPVKPLLYLRYINDIFCIFDQGEDKVLDFLDYMAQQ